MKAKQGERMLLEGLPLLLQALLKHKHEFLPDGTEDTCPGLSFCEILEKVDHNMADEVDDGKHWKRARDTIAEDLRALDYEDSHAVFCAKKSDLTLIDDMESATSRAEFYASLISTYTEDQYYHMVNMSLMREEDPGYSPDCHESHLGTYALLLDAVIFYWPQLEKVTGVTYRGMSMDQKVIDEYAVGTAFVWLYFCSTSPHRDVAERFAADVLFVFDNSGQSDWQPKLITPYNAFGEDEALYPIGAEFVVTQIVKPEDDEGPTEVHVKLVQPVAARPKA